MPADPKPPPRIVDRAAVRRKVLADPWCRVCGRHGVNGHHILGRGLGGDDIEANIVPLCGSGTTGHHGSYHAGDEETAMAVGHGLLADEVGYVFGKLGAAAGREFLARRYAWHGPDAV